MAFTLKEPTLYGFLTQIDSRSPPVKDTWYTLLELKKAGQLFSLQLKQDNAEAAAKNVEFEITVDDDAVYQDENVGTGTAIDSGTSFASSVTFVLPDHAIEAVNAGFYGMIYITNTIQFPLVWKKYVKIRYCLRSTAGTTQHLGVMGAYATI